MIDKEHLKVGNKVYTPSDGVAVIIKVGRKYTYTSNHHLIIENSRLMTKHTGYGVSTYDVFKSKEDYKEETNKAKFIRQVELRIRNLNLNMAKARIINHHLNLGVEE